MPGGQEQEHAIARLHHLEKTRSHGPRLLCEGTVRHVFVTVSRDEAVERRLRVRLSTLFEQTNQTVYFASHAEKEEEK